MAVAGAIVLLLGLAGSSIPSSVIATKGDDRS